MIPGEFVRTLSFVPCGDRNGDGVSEIAVGLPRDDAHGEDAGRVLVLDGRNGSIVRELHTGIEGSGFGFALATGADFDRDGNLDLVVAAHRDGWARGSDSTAWDRPGRIHVYSLATGERIREIDPPSGVKFTMAFASRIDVAADVDGDGVRDLLVLNRLEVNLDSGMSYPALVLGAMSGALLRSFALDLRSGNLDVERDAVAMVDLDGDGGRNVVVGTKDEIRWFSPKDKDKRTLAIEGLHVRQVSDVGDLDGDGRSELAIHGTTKLGLLMETVRVLSPRENKLLFEVEGATLRKEARVEALAAAQRFDVCGVPDFDGDGIGDLFVVLPGADTGFKVGFGALIGSRNGELLWTATGTRDSPLGCEWFAYDTETVEEVRRMPDLDGDGHDDVAVSVCGASSHETFEGVGAQLVILSSKSGARIAAFDFRAGEAPLARITSKEALEPKVK